MMPRDEGWPAATTRIGRSQWRDWSVTVSVLTAGDPADPDTQARASAVVRDRMAQVAACCNRFDETSEISRLNRGHRGKQTPISPLLRDLLSAALDGAAKTRGALDPTLGADLTAAGYSSTAAIGTVHADGTVRLEPRLRDHDWRDVTLKGDLLSLPEDLQLDLGATAKAQTADWCATTITERTGAGVCTNLGGDVATAGPEPDEGWLVLVQDDEHEPADHLALRGRTGLATSSTLHRRWWAEGHAVHHLLDPATGLSSVPTIRTASVVAPTCLEANIWTTAALARPMKAEPTLLGTGLPFRLVLHDGTVRRLRGWPSPDDHTNTPIGARSISSPHGSDGKAAA